MDPNPGTLLGTELEAGATHTYRLTLDAARFLRLLVHQDEIDVEVTVLAPSGDLVLRVDGPAGRRVAEQFSWVTRQAGGYRLEIRAVESSQAGSYRVEVEEHRAARPQDTSRVAAERHYVEAVHWRTLGTRQALRRAIDAYGVAQPLWRQVGDVGEEAKTVNQMGLAFLDLGETRQALQRFEAALPLRRAAGDARGQANTLTNIGAGYQKLGQVVEALGWYHQALDLWQALGDPPATIYQHIGSAHLDAGEAKKALDSFTRALEIRRRSNDPRGQASILNSMGICHRNLGDVRTAIEYYDQALKLSRRTHNLRVNASASSNLGQALRLQGDVQEALALYDEALEINRRLGDPAPIADVVQNLGTAFVEMGRMESARRYYREALQLFEGLGDERAAANVRRNLGWVDIALGNYEEALETLHRALATSVALADRRLEADTLFTLGVAHLYSDQPRRALDPLERALGLWQELGHGPRVVDTLSHLGAVHHELGDLATAFERLAEARSLGVGPSSHTTEALSLRRLALVERDRGNLGLARGHLARALEITERQRSRVPTPELRATFLARKRSYYEQYIDLLIRLHDRDPQGGYDRAAIEASERARARSLLDLLHERRNDIDRGLDPELESREKSIAAQRSQVQSQLMEERRSQAPRSHVIAALETRLEEVEQAEEQLEIEIRHKYRRYAELRYPEPLRLQQIQGLLDPRTVLLEYAIGNDGALLFAITRQGIESFPLPASASQIDRLVRQARSGLVEPGQKRLGRYRVAAYRLYELLIAPALRTVNPKSHLLIVPDRGLHYLPFEALLTQPPASSGHSGLGELPYLIRRWSVSYAPSASVLHSLARRRRERSAPAPGKKFLAFADPVYEASSSGAAGPEARITPAGSQPQATEGGAAGPLRLQRLESSAREVRGIAGLYPSDASVLYLGSEATEENVKDNELVSHAQRIHFATHGLLDEGRPRSYGLVLSLDEDPRQDGWLQVYEIFNLRLRAELVVLSACETGLGQEVTGEGLMGLNRAFLYAGAARVVVSLWSVADRSTADLMVQFYSEFDARESPAAALAAAKLSLLDGRFAHPYYWAPFVLVGTP